MRSMKPPKPPKLATLNVQSSRLAKPMKLPKLGGGRAAPKLGLRKMKTRASIYTKGR